MSKYASFEGFEAAFLNQIELQPAWAKKISRYFENVDGETIKYAAIGSGTAVSEWKEGDNRQIISPANYKLIVENKRYSTAMQVPVSAVERDTLGVFEATVRGQANKMENHWNGLVDTLMDTNANGYDGVAYFSASHPLYDNATQSNLLDSNDLPALAGGTAAQPTAEKASLVLAQAIAYMQGFKDESGSIATSDAKSFMVITGTAAVYGAFLSAVSKDNLASGESNLVTAMIKNGISVEVVYDPNAASATTFFVARTDGVNKPFVLQSEKGIQFQSVTDPNDGHVFATGNYLFGAYDYRGAGYGDYRTIIKCTLS